MFLDERRPHKELTVFDASSGYGSACLGAGHPVIVDAALRSLSEDGYVTDEVASCARSDLLVRLFGKGGIWADIFPGTEYRVIGRSSGSEGIEMALRIALESRWDSNRMLPRSDRAQRNKILAFEGAWHGWTAGACALLNRRYYRMGLPEILGGIEVVHIPFGDVQSLESIFSRSGDTLLSAVVEPIQGDAGILMPPVGYLKRLVDLCRLNDVLLIADEVLTFSKTGRFFALRKGKFYPRT